MAVTVKLNNDGFDELRLSPPIDAVIKAAAEKIAAAAGDGFEVIAEPSKHRARYAVKTATLAARQAEANDRALTRAIDAGRS